MIRSYDRTTRQDNLLIKEDSEMNKYRNPARLLALLLALTLAFSLTALPAAAEGSGRPDINRVMLIGEDFYYNGDKVSFNDEGYAQVIWNSIPVDVTQDLETGAVSIDANICATTDTGIKWKIAAFSVSQAASLPIVAPVLWTVCMLGKTALSA